MTKNASCTQSHRQCLFLDPICHSAADVLSIVFRVFTLLGEFDTFFIIIAPFWELPRMLSVPLYSH
jgi:hypothetical protein